MASAGQDFSAAQRTRRVDGYVIMVYGYNLLTRLAHGAEHLQIQRTIIGRSVHRAGDPILGGNDYTRELWRARTRAEHLTVLRTRQALQQITRSGPRSRTSAEDR